MKRYILIFIALFCFFCPKNIFASTASFSTAERLDGISYLKYDGKTYYFMNFHVIRNDSTGDVAYCIDPFSTLIDGSVYNGYVTQNGIFNLSSYNWKRIQLLTHYGYGYKGHTDKKWIAITQFLIWKTANPNATFEWLDNTDDRNIITKFSDEIAELNNLVTKHLLLPSFPNYIKLSVGKSNELVDNAKVLDKFVIEETDLDAKILEDKLIITSDTVKKGKILLTKDYRIYNHDMEFFYCNGSQSLVSVGNIKPHKLLIDVDIVAGEVEITKVDSSTSDIVPLGEGSLIGATYEVINSNNESVGLITIGDDNKGKLGNLPYGSYIIKEVSPGIGYKLDSNEYEFEVNGKNLDIKLNLSNEVIKSNIKIIKFFGTKKDLDLKTLKREKDVLFEVYDKDNNMVYSGKTDESGQLDFILPYGTYTVKQITTMDNYQKVDDFQIVINDESEENIEFELIDLKVEVPNAYVKEYKNNFFDYLLLLIINLFLGVVVFVYDY